MKCVICNNSDVQLKTVEEEIKSDGDIFLFPMKILVCSSCGERYYDRKNMKQLEEMRARIKEKTLKVQEVGRVLQVQAV